MNYKRTILVIGESGVGKSTLINAVLGEDKAPTGEGRSVTHKVSQYYVNKPISSGDMCDFTLIDTVGFEVNHATTQEAKAEIEEQLQRSVNSGDKTMIWLCINELNNRFQDFLQNTLMEISLRYEVPIMFVITRSINEESDELEQTIRCKFPEIIVLKTLAQDFKLRGGAGSVSAYGVDELLLSSVKNYDLLKSNIHNSNRRYELLQMLSKLEKSFSEMEHDIEHERRSNKWELQRIKEKGEAYISDRASESFKVGFVPILSVPIIHGRCIDMLYGLDEIAGLDRDTSAKSFFEGLLKTIVVTPFMLIPVIGSYVAESYVKTVGHSYLDALISIVKEASDKELRNKEDILRKVREKFKSELKHNSEVSGQKINILVAGETGSGKSTLINSVFGSELAETGIGSAVTHKLEQYSKPGYPFQIWDTVGLELDANVTRRTIQDIEDVHKAWNIRAAWYCINSNSSRYLKADIDLIKKLRSFKIPVIIVMTQCIREETMTSQFEKSIRRINKENGMSDIEVVQILAADYDIGGFTIPKFDLDKLTDMTFKLVR